MLTNNLSRVSKDKQTKGKKNTQRRYSLLLLILLFIGFSSYGTYSYFTTSTSLVKGHRKLENRSFHLGEDELKMRPGDGTAGAHVNNTNYHTVANLSQDATDSNMTVDGNDEVSLKHLGLDGSTNQSKNNSSNIIDNKYKEFGEFEWVYVGNTSGRTIRSLADTFQLTQKNPYISVENTNIYNNVKSGDVFRKTVRLKIKGNSSTPANVSLRWGKVDNEYLDMIQAAVYVKKGKLTRQGEAPMFKTDGFLTAFDSIPLTSDAQYTSDELMVKSGEYLDVEMIIAVKNDVTVLSDVPLAKVERQLSIVLTQDTGNILDV